MLIDAGFAVDRSTGTSIAWNPTLRNCNAREPDPNPRKVNTPLSVVSVRVDESKTTSTPATGMPCASTTRPETTAPTLLATRAWGRCNATNAKGRVATSAGTSPVARPLCSARIKPGTERNAADAVLAAGHHVRLEHRTVSDDRSPGIANGRI